MNKDVHKAGAFLETLQFNLRRKAKEYIGTTWLQTWRDRICGNVQGEQISFKKKK